MPFIPRRRRTPVDLSARRNSMGEVGSRFSRALSMAWGFGYAATLAAAFAIVDFAVCAVACGFGWGFVADLTAIVFIMAGGFALFTAILAVLAYIVFRATRR